MPPVFINVDYTGSYEHSRFINVIGTVFVILKGCTYFILEIRIILSGYSYLYY